MTSDLWQAVASKRESESGMDCDLKLNSATVPTRKRSRRGWPTVLSLLAVAVLLFAADLDSAIALACQQQGPALESAAQTNGTSNRAGQGNRKSVVRFGSQPLPTTQPPQDTQKTPSAQPSSATNQQTNMNLASDKKEVAAPAAAALKQFDPAAAFEHLKNVCKIGPRISASRGMKKQQEYIKAHFESIGGAYYTQPFKVNSPFDGRQVQLENIMIRWHPERTKRVLICCHHDTRPFADADRRNPRAKFIGANDGASGVALLCELGKHIADMKGDYGVDFMFFDGEEFVIVRQRDRMFLGSTFFAQYYASGQLGWTYEEAILVDMVADKDLQIFMEGNSLNYARQLTQDIFAIANQLGVREFVPQQKHMIRDDHLPLNEIARIPTCDIIDFDYPNPQAGNSYWHTRNDKVQNCSADSLGKVGSVVLAWLRHKQNPAKQQPIQNIQGK